MTNDEKKFILILYGFQFEPISWHIDQKEIIWLPGRHDFCYTLKTAWEYYKNGCNCSLVQFELS